LSSRILKHIRISSDFGAPVAPVGGGSQVVFGGQPTARMAYGGMGWVGWVGWANRGLPFASLAESNTPGSGRIAGSGEVVRGDFGICTVRLAMGGGLGRTAKAVAPLPGGFAFGFPCGPTPRPPKFRNPQLHLALNRVTGLRVQFAR